MARFEPPKEHDPQFAYNCERCKFNWNCGFTCACVMETRFRCSECGARKKMPAPPKKRQNEVNAALIAGGYAPEFLAKGKRERGP